MPALLGLLCTLEQFYDDGGEFLWLPANIVQQYIRRRTHTIDLESEYILNKSIHRECNDVNHHARGQAVRNCFVNKRAAGPRTGPLCHGLH